MKLLPVDFKFFEGGLLSKPGDKLLAKITSTGRQVLTVDTSFMKRSFTRYPSTGTIVETIVRKRI